MNKTPALALSLLALAAPATAQAGTYHVYSCAINGRSYVNNAWKAAQPAAAIGIDTNCTGGIGLSAGAGARTPDDTNAQLNFTSPPGTTIADFTLVRSFSYTDPTVKDTHRYYLLESLDGTHFSGAGNFDNPTRNALHAQNQWYGYPNDNTSVPPGTVSRRSFPALNSYAGNATHLIFRLGCFKRGSGCSVDTGGGINHLIYGSDVIVNDAGAPNATVEAAGLLSGGYHNGSDPVTVDASDASGIRAVQLIDTATNAVVGSEDYTRGRTDAGRICDFSIPAPCPTLTHETVRATSLPAGQRSVLVRVTDTAGNLRDLGPYPVFAVTAADRGPANGTNVTETGTLQVEWTKGGHSGRTLAYGEHAGVRGRLLNSSGARIGGAKVQVITRDLRTGNPPLVTRTTLVTKSDGTFSTVVAATASRLIQFAWAAHANDIRFAANDFLTLRARAGASITTSTRHPRVGHSFSISGKLKGVDRGGVPVIVQARQPGSHHYVTFADTTSASTGRFKVHYRFRTNGARGHHYVFRARIRPPGGFPYETGYSHTVTVSVR